MTHIGFTGTRYGMSEAQQLEVAALVATIFDVGQISLSSLRLYAHHGCCKGGDEQFHQIVRQHRDVIIIGHPMIGIEWQATNLYAECHDMRKPKAPLVRNGDIVTESLHAMIAAPFEDVKQDRGGTWRTIDMANKAKRPLAIVWRSGEVTKERWA